MSDSSNSSEVLNQAASLADPMATTNIKPFVSTGILALLGATALITALPVVKIGPGRALSILLRSVIYGKASVVSQRTRDLENLKDRIFRQFKPGHFLVVQEPMVVIQPMDRSIDPSVVLQLFCPDALAIREHQPKKQSIDCNPRD